MKLLKKFKQFEKLVLGAEEATLPHWPVLVVRTPKGWTGPKEWNHEPIQKVDSIALKFQSVSGEAMEHVMH